MNQLLLLLSVFNVQASEKCADGSHGLTKALYEAAGGDKATYFQNITCIPSKAFLNYQGTLRLSGSFPALKSIGADAFHNASTATSCIILKDLHRLEIIGAQAFVHYRGAVRLSGSLPALERIGASAFAYASNPASHIALKDATSLKTIARNAFLHAHGGICKSMKKENDAFPLPILFHLEDGRVRLVDTWSTC